MIELTSNKGLRIIEMHSPNVSTYIYGLNLNKQECENIKWIHDNEHTCFCIGLGKNFLKLSRCTSSWNVFH